MKTETKKAPEGEVCNFCGSSDDLKELPLSEGFWYCKNCRERFELQEKMIQEGLEIQPELE